MVREILLSVPSFSLFLSGKVLCKYYRSGSSSFLSAIDHIYFVSFLHARRRQRGRIRPRSKLSSSVIQRDQIYLILEQPMGNLFTGCSPPMEIKRAPLTTGTEDPSVDDKGTVSRNVTSDFVGSYAKRRFLRFDAVAVRERSPAARQVLPPVSFAINASPSLH